MTDSAIVRLEHVSVSYREVVALEDVSFAVRAGVKKPTVAQRPLGPLPGCVSAAFVK